MPFEELPHTADFCLHVWASDMATLFVESARGMNDLAGYGLDENSKAERTFSTSAMDPESLLVAFLSELIYFAEKDHLAFDRFDLELDINFDKISNISTTLHGAAILSTKKMIKAVTYHNLKIQKTVKGFEVEIVFDV